MTQHGTNSVSRRAVLAGGVAAAAGAMVSHPAAQAARLGGGATKPKAKSLIQIWMWGGPSHLDTFDPKPDAGDPYCGPYKSPIKTNVNGIRIAETLPLLAKQADKYSIIRSMTHGNNAHETASYLMQTGHTPSRHVFPCIGAVVSKLRSENYKGIVPPYVVLTQPQGRFSEAGFLGPKYKPFATGGDPGKDPFEVEGIVARGITDQRQRARRKLLGSLDTLGRALPKNRSFAEFDRCEDKAYDLMFGDAKKLFDLTTEKDAIREAYGKNTFGQACLMARRLVESGVPYITINSKGWDTHKQHFETMRRRLPEVDQGLAMLFKDLSDRGLLDSTIVWWGGEFGRTPKVQWDPPWNGGRGHHGKCFSAVVAGGGFKGGRVVGSSDEKGVDVRERPVVPRELLRSMYTLLGIDPDGPLPNPRGLPVRVLASDEAGEQNDGLLHEIL